MNYLDIIADEIQRVADPDAALLGKDLPLYRLYAVLLLAKGQQVELEDVHNAWAAWAIEHDPDNRRILPFKELSLSVQRKDEAYVDAIREVAARLRIGEPPTGLDTYRQ